MSFKDFEKYNGMKFSDFIRIKESGYNRETGDIDCVNVEIQYAEDMPEADVRLTDGTLIGHGETADFKEYVFEASDKEWS